MAIACPIDLDTKKLRDEIQFIYARVARAPYGVVGVNVFCRKG
jgi:hypothetical protein